MTNTSLTRELLALAENGEIPGEPDATTTSRPSCPSGKDHELRVAGFCSINLVTGELVPESVDPDHQADVWCVECREHYEYDECMPQGVLDAHHPIFGNSSIQTIGVNLAEIEAQITEMGTTVVPRSLHKFEAQAPVRVSLHEANTSLLEAKRHLKELLGQIKPAT